ncbi:ATP-binding protein [Altererythrobacter sp. Root672]|uniref:ATP-binding protein n=1 Tax=Altererythrobacter sp. Root672 TaxID=1736584 RepID=UPI001F1BB2D1|nr:ATP-binding protein [Altererythrobacter sp. Root672]
MTDLIERTLGPAWPLQVELSEDIPPVVGDPNQLEMALLNLAVNARDAMADGGCVRITTERRLIAADETTADGLLPGLYVGLTVADSGHGMDEATLEKATEPFFTTKGVGKGTGLGLPMVHGLAKQLGGSFQIRSQVGVGTTAILWLPAAGAHHETEVLPARPITALTSRSLKVLAVDDDPLVLMNTGALLEDLGHEVFEAISAENALALLQEHPDIDVLITDQAMPHMTGAQLVQELTRLRPELPIILATGYGELPAGFKQSVIKLTKPFSQALLENALAQALDI